MQGLLKQKCEGKYLDGKENESESGVAKKVGSLKFKQLELKGQTRASSPEGSTKKPETDSVCSKAEVIPSKILTTKSSNKQDSTNPNCLMETTRSNLLSPSSHGLICLPHFSSLERVCLERVIWPLS